MFFFSESFVTAHTIQANSKIQDISSDLFTATVFKCKFRYSFKNKYYGKEEMVKIEVMMKWFDEKLQCLYQF